MTREEFIKYDDWFGVNLKECRERIREAKRRTTPSMIPVELMENSLQAMRDANQALRAAYRFMSQHNGTGG